MDFVEKEGIHLVVLNPFPSTPPQALAYRSKYETLSEQTVIRALELMVDQRNYPMAVMCTSGRGKTGIVVGCLRKLMRWNMTSIFEEYRRYASSMLRLLNEQFIELFDVSVVRVGKNCPDFMK